MQDRVHAIFRPIVTLVIPLIILGIIYAIAVRLPGVDKTLYIGHNLLVITISTIIAAGIGIAVVIAVLKFGVEIGSFIGGVLTDFTEFSIVAKHLIYLAAIWITYGVLRGVALPFFRGAIWVYPLAFFAISLFPLCIIAARLLGSIDKWSSFIRRRTEKGEAIECPECKKTVPPGSEFCSYCGAKLTEPEEKGGKECSQCGAELPPGTLFCPKCGTKV